MSIDTAQSTVEILPAVIPRTRDAVEVLWRQVGCSGATIHVDATDGVYVSEASWIPEEGVLLPDTGNIYEAHLMVKDQKETGRLFIAAGAKRIIGQLEVFASDADAKEALGLWKESGAEVGLAVLIDTPLATLEPFAKYIDVLQIMSIPTIGAQGVSFDERTWQRIAEARRLYPHVPLAVDGGVKIEHVARLASAGVARAVVGSGILKSDSPRDMYLRMMREASGAI